MKINFSNIDGGREGLWQKGKWLLTLKTILKYNRSRVYDENNPIYRELADLMPQDTWATHSSGSFRPLFRDYSHPWQRTGVVSFDNEIFEVTEKGESVAKQEISYEDFLAKFIYSYSHDGIRPFVELLEIINTNYVDKFSGDNLDRDLEVSGDTERRRIRLALKLLEYAGFVSKVENSWIILNREKNFSLPDRHSRSLVDLKISSPVSNLLASLLAKQFLIFTGLSGSGKSRIAKQIASSLSSDDYQYHFAAVGPDWNNRDPLLGYPDGIHPSVYQTTPVLELLIRADKPENQNKPFFLILDEMNLSHVERYFADFLSAMESDEKISLYEGGIRGDTPPSIALPPNLFIIGTVNIDETTYQFSPKVLDRANVIEFKMDKGDVGKFFAGSSVVDDFGAMAGIAEEFVSDAKTNDQVAIDWAAEHPSFATEMEVLFKILQNFNGEFGFRTLKESSRYLYFHNKYSVIEDDNAKYQDAMDCIILQKLLPKLHGSRSKVEGILRALLHFCETTDRDLEKLEQASIAAAAKTDISLDQLGAGIAGHYKQSHHKLKRMCKKLHQDQFVSFADA